MNRFFYIVIIIGALIPWSPLEAQKCDSLKLLVHPASVSGPDTVLNVRLKEVPVYGRRRNKIKNYRNTREYWRTVRNIQIVYPYARAANDKIEEISIRLQNITSRKERRRLIRSEYRNLMKEYKAPLMRLKISQGKLLIKLIDRETGNTSYEHLKELKGTVTAVFWQSVAILFGSNLKAEYNPLGKDWMIEEILLRMENGELPPPRRF